jgi:hypothetical protein
MSITTVAVICTAFDDGGAAIEGATFTATLDITELSGAFIAPEPVVGTTDASGTVTINLWPNEEGYLGSFYKVTATNPSTSKRFLNNYARIPEDTGSPIYLHECLVDSDAGDWVTPANTVVTGLIAAHNTDTAAHADIRALLYGLTNLGTVTGTVTMNATTGTQRLVAGGDLTIAAPTNPTNGQKLRLHAIQDATGSRLFTWNVVFKWASGTPPVLSTAAGARDLLEWTYDSISAVWVGSMLVKGAA